MMATVSQPLQRPSATICAVTTKRPPIKGQLQSAYHVDDATVNAKLLALHVDD